ncbi:DUF4870 domain-containing protein [Neptunitalea lumnitzerae]|uniref:Membrane protein n=1 Tax=Neptunitalea lumnitzerae TaxID=2965509 RepID=A0ABQ5MJX2_9FLAO|nr:hypothetical protein [Neptunitalea sp. Y10]GLB49716.1 membrane protein [Neptunitalea sp. Y10]
MEEDKTLAIISYLTFLGTILAYFMNLEKRSELVFFHVRQMLGMFLIFLIAQIISYVNIYISLGFWLLNFACWCIGMVAAVQGKRQPIPIIGAYFQKWFHAIGKYNA